MASRAAHAQFTARAEIGYLHFWGATENRPDSSGALLRPYGPTFVGVAFGMHRQSWQYDLGLMYSGAGAAAVGFGLTFLDETGTQLAAILPAVERRIATSSGNGQLWIALGPSIEIWGVAAGPRDEARVLLGGRAALMWRQPISRHFKSAISASWSVSPSPFTQFDLTGIDTLRPATTHRITVGVGVEYIR
jgi:hypothetical protein